MKWDPKVLKLRRVAITLLGLLLLLGAILRIQSYLFRRQAEHLMADFETLRLRQSKWPEAESLTRKWGKYGRYQGDCNASFCRYNIELNSLDIRMTALLPRRVWENRFVNLTASGFIIPYEFLGRSATVRVTFVVQDAIVLRKSAVFIYQVPSFHANGGYALIATSRATSRLSSDEYLLTYSDQLAKHPYYMYTRPGGCTFCHMANVSYTPDTPESELRWLTTFNLACLTNFKPCRYLEDIYPPSEDWHLYDGYIGGRPAPAHKADSEPYVPPNECRIPVFALGREAAKIISVTSLKQSQEQHLNEVDQKATVRFDSVLKGAAVYSSGEAIDVVSRFYSGHIPSLTPGEHLLLLSQYFEKEPQPLELGRCLVLPDTPEIRAELQRGIAQNDRLRYPDPNASNFIPD